METNTSEFGREEVEVSPLAVKGDLDDRSLLFSMSEVVKLGMFNDSK